MMKRLFFSAVCFVFAAAALVFLPSCEKKEPEKDTSDYGSMNITSEPAGAEVSILGKVWGTTPYMTKPVPSAMYIVKFAMDGYEPAWLPVTVTPGRQVEAHVALVPENATVIIDSEPTGAHVQMNGKEIGDTPVLLPDLALGSYSATVQMTGYTRRDISWKVQNGRPILIKVPLMNNIGTLSLVSDPDAAEIEIDGQSYGSTPFRDFLEQGQHRIRLTKNGYKPYEKIVTVNRDETTDVEARMETLPGSLSLESVPTGAALFINGIDYGVTPYKRDVIEAGDYTIRLTMDGYDSLEQTITVHPGEPMSRTFTLDSNLGSIILSVNPPGVNVYLDGKFICRTEAESKSRDISKRVTIKNLASGEHTITVSNKHAKPDVKDITVTVGKGKTVQVPEVTLWLPDTTIVLKNGSKYTGRLTDKYSEDSKRFSFRHSAGITSEYNRDDIKEIIPLNIIDGE
ncbi:MAG: PEGA domain-containing protein [Lentisphaeria bacterium]|nr:PEGA domain-containing protein [Lentisphaeria bacterium]